MTIRWVLRWLYTCRFSLLNPLGIGYTQLLPWLMNCGCLREKFSSCAPQSSGQRIQTRKERDSTFTLLGSHAWNNASKNHKAPLQYVVTLQLSLWLAFLCTLQQPVYRIILINCYIGLHLGCGNMPNKGVTRYSYFFHCR